MYRPSLRLHQQLLGSAQASAPLVRTPTTPVVPLVRLSSGLHTASIARTAPRTLISIHSSHNTDCSDHRANSSTHEGLSIKIRGTRAWLLDGGPRRVNRLAIEERSTERRTTGVTEPTRHTTEPWRTILGRVVVEMVYICVERFLVFGRV